jgi:hypothetical protein
MRHRWILHSMRCSVFKMAVPKHSVYFSARLRIHATPGPSLCGSPLSVSLKTLRFCSRSSTFCFCQEHLRMALIRCQSISAPRLQELFSPFLLFSFFLGGARLLTQNYFWDIPYSDLFRYVIDWVSTDVFLGYLAKLFQLHQSHSQMRRKVFHEWQFVKGFEGDVCDLFKGNIQASACRD